MSRHATETDSLDVPLFEFRDTDPGVVVSFDDDRRHWTPAYLLSLMRQRLACYGSPLPDGFAPPPGIDLDALLKQVPWPPPE